MAMPRSQESLESPAKINLFLEVLGKRPDGYHELVTVMQRVSLHDVLTLEPRPSGIEITCSDPSIPTDEGNLVWRAADALRRRAGGRWGCRVHIEKRIPAGAGLGGGSSNAATALAGLNGLFHLGLSRETLCQIAAGLGSDVPFFLDGPTAVCRGRGELVEPLACPHVLHYVLLLPGLHVSTAEVYGRLAQSLTPCHKDGTVFIRTLLRGRPDAIGRELFNRLETPAFDMRPQLAQLSRQMTRLGACGTLMSGSGSTLFALCRDSAHAAELAYALSANGWGDVLVVVSDTS